MQGLCPLGNTILPTGQMISLKAFLLFSNPPVDVSSIRKTSILSFNNMDFLLWFEHYAHKLGHILPIYLLFKVI